MNTPVLLAAILLSVSGIAGAQVYDWSTAPLTGVKLNTVAFQGWIPARMRFNPPAVIGTAPATTPSIFKSLLPTFSQQAATGAAPPELHKIDLRSGYLGDAETYDFVGFDSFKGNKAKAIWLPDEATAAAWRDYLLH